MNQIDRGHHRSVHPPPHPTHVPRKARAPRLPHGDIRPVHATWPKWWHPYLDETDQDALKFAAMFTLGGVGALLAIGARWAFQLP